jgi:glycosyltransferase involved in cell wall biosynthesis
MSKSLRVAILADYREEGWTSMDLVAEMTVRALQDGGRVSAELFRPALPASLGRWAGKRGHNLDRLLGRFWRYPRTLARAASRFDVFHITDHSYSQLVHVLPPGKCLVTCHDMDTFRCLLPTNPETRPWWFRQMTQRTLSGLRKAAHVTCVSQATAGELESTGWIRPDRLSVIPNGIGDEYFSPATAEAQAWVGDWLTREGAAGSAYLLHVGSTIARKRIDVLLRAFAAAVAGRPDLRLVRVGGPLSPEQARLAGQLGIASRIHTAPRLDRPQLNEMYARAALVLQTSSYEGFGLPVVEAQACGAIVIASRIPAMEEVGGPATAFCPVEDIAAWKKEILDLLHLSESNPAAWATRRAAARQWAARYRWSNVADRLADRYQYLAEIMN